MIISVKRSGGYAGETVDLGTVDTEQLNSQEAEQVEQMIRSVNFYNMPPVYSGEEGFDLTRYEIAINDGRNQHVVAVEGEGSLDSTSLRQLVDFVSRRR